MEIRRFGVGHRRTRGPAGTRGVTGQVIHADARGSITELAFTRRARMEPHLSPNSAWLLVIEGGGLVLVGDERALVAAGEAVHLPAGIPHAVWTEHAELRAFVVELGGADDALLRGILDADRVRRPIGSGPVSKGEGRLASTPGRPPHDPEAQEPD